MAEDGVLPDWFRIPHKKFGTSARIITMIVALQIVTVVLTRGNIQLLGDAYAFGIVWSFAMKGLSVLVLRFKQPQEREWKVPLNFRIGGKELPLGLSLITLVLFAIALINLVTKKVATIWGMIFTIVIYVIFLLSERINHRRTNSQHAELEKFRLVSSDILSQDAISARPGNVLVAIRNPRQLDHLQRVLERTDTRKIDIVVLTVKRQGSGGYDLQTDQIFSDQVAELFSKVVSVAEKAGKHVELLVVPERDYNRATVDVAQQLQSSLIVMGLSAKMSPSEQAKTFGDAWELLPHPRPQLSLEILDQLNQKQRFFNLGPHPPRLWPEDVEFLHQLWREISELGLGHKLHHRDVVRVALKRLGADLRSAELHEVLADIRKEVSDEKNVEENAALISHFVGSGSTG